MMFFHPFRKIKNLILDAIILILAIIVAVDYVRYTQPTNMISTAINTADMASTTVRLISQDNLNENGTAIITDNGNDTSQVVFTIINKPASADEVALIYTGSCSLLGGKVYVLNDLVDGVSTTTIGVSFSEMLGQQLPLALNVFDPAQSTSSAACGDLENI